MTEAPRRSVKQSAPPFGVSACCSMRRRRGRSGRLDRTVSAFAEPSAVRRPRVRKLAPSADALERPLVPSTLRLWRRRRATTQQSGGGVRVGRWGRRWCGSDPNASADGGGRRVGRPLTDRAARPRRPWRLTGRGPRFGCTVWLPAGRVSSSPRAKLLTVAESAEAGPTTTVDDLFLPSAEKTDLRVDRVVGLRRHGLSLRRYSRKWPSRTSGLPPLPSGVWLDINDINNQRFPLDPTSNPGGVDGPYQNPRLTIQQLVTGLHYCLVAEVFFWPPGTGQTRFPSARRRGRAIGWHSGTLPSTLLGIPAGRSRTRSSTR
jgi:hypothetical protein